jgi:hypothetical protein
VATLIATGPLASVATRGTLRHVTKEFKVKVPAELLDDFDYYCRLFGSERNATIRKCMQTYVRASAQTARWLDPRDAAAALRPPTDEGDPVRVDQERTLGRPRRRTERRATGT